MTPRGQRLADAVAQLNRRHVPARIMDLTGILPRAPLAQIGQLCTQSPCTITFSSDPTRVAPRLFGPTPSELQELLTLGLTADEISHYYRLAQGMGISLKDVASARQPGEPLPVVLRRLQQEAGTRSGAVSASAPSDADSFREQQHRVIAAFTGLTEAAVKARLTGGTTPEVLLAAYAEGRPLPSLAPYDVLRATGIAKLLGQPLSEVLRVRGPGDSWSEVTTCLHGR